MDRKQISVHIFKALNDQKAELTAAYKTSSEQIGYFYIDNLLPDTLARQVYAAFPTANSMMRRKSLREYKFVAAQMNQYKPLLTEVIFAFQEPSVVEIIQEICGINSLVPDENLYAGGISLMGQQQFLNPHLDNSHEIERKRWRVLNLLYYTSPDWQEPFGGNLELWPEGVEGEAITIESRFNRLVVMATHDDSWHSVSPITENALRTCVSNYYFSDNSLRAQDKFHVTSFRGRPEQKLRDLALRADRLIRQSVRKIFPKGVVETKHVYKKSDK